MCVYRMCLCGATETRQWMCLYCLNERSDAEEQRQRCGDKEDTCEKTIIIGVFGVVFHNIFYENTVGYITFLDKQSFMSWDFYTFASNYIQSYQYGTSKWMFC